LFDHAIERDQTDLAPAGSNESHLTRAFRDSRHCSIAANGVKAPTTIKISTIKSTMAHSPQHENNATFVPSSKSSVFQHSLMKIA
jgi:hypothetical protein